MAKKNKFYAVKKGNKTGVYHSWEECQEATKGFSGAEFKSFESEDEAQAYLNDEDIVYKNDILPRLKEGKVVAFVDGSFNPQKRVYGYGIHIITPDNGNPVELCGKAANEKYIDLRNMAGEILGAINAIDWAWKNCYNKIVIFHDLEGISKWADGSYKAQTPLSQFYRRYIEEKQDVIQIEFVKVSGHSNNRYNDRADLLAKGSVNDNKILKDSNGNNGYIIGNIHDAQVQKMLETISSEYDGLQYSVSHYDNKNVYTVTFNKEKVTISLFNDIKLMVQGRRNNLFQMITTSIVESVECGDFIKVLRDAYEIKIDKDKVTQDYKNELFLLQNCNLPDNLEKLLRQSIIDLNNPGYGDIEFSKYTFSVLRALEGVLKFNLSRFGIYVKKTGFDMFEKDNSNGAYKLKPKTSNKIDLDSINKLENCYNHYYNQRHTLCHFGIVIGGLDTNTRLINSKEEANMIIKDTLKIINDNYII